MTLLRRLVKILILVFIANALYQFVPPYYHYLRFRDGVQETALYPQRMSDIQIVDRVTALAERLGVPVDRDVVQVQHEGGRVVINASYDETMTFVPGYPYTWHFDVGQAP